jgi:hypothetical protein
MYAEADEFTDDPLGHPCGLAVSALAVESSREAHDDDR